MVRNQSDYDHNRQRVVSATNNINPIFTPNKYYTYDVTNNKKTKNIYLDNMLVGYIDNSTIYHTLIDHLGSIEKVTDNSGDMVSQTNYKSFGEETNAGTQSYRKYIGEQYDNSTKLNYLNARYYDANRGQFISQDPVFWEVGLTSDGQQALLNPQSQNSYSYAGNNPITQKDPSGRFIPALLAGVVFGIAYLHDTSVASAPGINTDIGSTPNTARIFDNALANSMGYDYSNWPQWRKNEMADGIDSLLMSASLFNLGSYKYSQLASSKNAPSIQNISRGDLPSNVQDSLKQYEAVGWTSKGRTSGTGVGKNYRNDTGLLPKGYSYKEYDVNSKVQGSDKDMERFVRGSDGSVYYTNNHYGDVDNGQSAFVKVK